MAQLDIPPPRLARAEDARALTRLSAGCFARHYRGWYDDETLRAALPELSRPDPALLASCGFFVVEAAEALLACGGWSPLRSPGAGQLRHFAVRHDLTGRGLGSAVMEETLGAAGAAGIETLSVKASLPAEPFYARHGFVAESFDRIRLRCGRLFSVVTMRREGIADRPA